jgi:hypothetical protein
MRFYVLGGKQVQHAAQVEEWHGCEAALAIEADVDAGRNERRVSYQSPPDACPDRRPSFVFKAGTLAGSRLYACTQTELLVYALPGFALERRISLPCFNDLHHVTPSPWVTLLVADTGLDMVVELSPEGERLREWSALGEDPWQRFDRERDYRKIASTKPHRAHPNYVFLLGDEIFTTRFEQRDAVSLTRPGRRIVLDGAQPHDGVLHGDTVYFTRVDGSLVLADAATLEVRRVLDLTRLGPDEKLLGWCRGLHVVDPDHVVVGFSRLRQTRFRENLSWLQARLAPGRRAGCYPSRIALYDLRAEKLVWEHETEDAGLDIVFSVHAAP